MNPVIIEVALNGSSKDHGNLNIPHEAADVVRDAIACLEAGAAIIHTHADNFGTVQGCIDRYLESYRPILARHPDAILCPAGVEMLMKPDAYGAPAFGLAGSGGMGAVEQAYAHVEALTQAGVKMFIADPGTLNFTRGNAEDGTPLAEELTYINTYGDMKVFFDILRANRAGPSISVFEPGFLRATIAYHKAGRLPAGSFVKLYFGGDYNPFSRKKTGAGFGLPPTPKALDAYLEMLEGTGLPWSVAVIGGDVVACGLAKYALEQGGSVRVGVEDFGGERKPSNLELLEALKAVIRQTGREIADCATAARLLGIPEMAPA